MDNGSEDAGVYLCAHRQVSWIVRLSMQRGSKPFRAGAMSSPGGHLPPNPLGQHRNRNRFAARSGMVTVTDECSRPGPRRSLATGGWAL